VDGDALTVAAVTQGAHGAVTLNADGTLTYTPGANFNGSDAFTYTVSDGHGGTATATVTVTVNPATPTNRPPDIRDGDLTLSAAVIDEGGSVNPAGHVPRPGRGPGPHGRHRLGRRLQRHDHPRPGRGGLRPRRPHLPGR